MEQILLKDEEIQKLEIIEESINPQIRNLDELIDKFEKINRAIAKAQLRKLVKEWGKFNLDTDTEGGYKLIPYYAWEALLKEIED